MIGSNTAFFRSAPAINATTRQIAEGSQTAYPHVQKRAHDGRHQHLSQIVRFILFESSFAFLGSDLDRAAQRLAVERGAHLVTETEENGIAEKIAIEKLAVHPVWTSAD